MNQVRSTNKNKAVVEIFIRQSWSPDELRWQRDEKGIYNTKGYNEGVSIDSDTIVP